MMFEDWLREAMDTSSRGAGTHPQSPKKRRPSTGRSPTPAGVIARRLVAEGERDAHKVAAASGLSPRSVEAIILAALRAAA